MATNCAAEAGEGAGAAFLWTDEVSPDWFFNCSDRPEPHGLASVPASRKIMARRQRAAVKRGAEAPSGPERLRISNQVATLEMAKAEFEASWKQWKAWAKLEETEGAASHLSANIGSAQSGLASKLISGARWPPLCIVRACRHSDYP